ncbi:AAA family ATPase [Pseudothermotoga sp. U03pept]|uniref:ATP-binding protein n=1 Tax=Pseudothermotoga sp. U03pept TaxID=3447012 RepID=UPI003F02C209
MSFLKVKELKILGFGKFHNCQVHFTDGVNIVVGPNESGKTTLYKFIISNLAGLDEDELSRYKPWDFDEFGGSLVVERIREEELFIGQPLLDRKYLESLSLLSDEEDLMELFKADETVIARLKRKMAQLEEAERISILLKRQPDFEAKLLVSERILDEEIDQLQRQIERFKEERNRLFALLGNKYAVEKQIETLLSQKQQATERLKNVERQIDEELVRIANQLNGEIRELQQQLETEKQLPIVGTKEYTEIVQLYEKIQSAEKNAKDTEGKIDELMKRQSDTGKEIEEIEKELGWQEDIDKMRLRVKNFELSYRVLEGKLEQIQRHERSYQAGWDVFKREDDKILRSLEKEIPTSLELETRQTNNKLQFIESEISRQTKRASSLRIFTVLVLIFAVASVALGFFLDPMWFYVSAAAGLASIVLFVTVKSTARSLQENEEQKVKLQLELRAIEKKKHSAIQRLLSAFGVNSIEELRQSYEQYRDWLRRDQELEEFKKKLSSEVKVLIDELSRFGAKEISDVPSVILRLSTLLETLERKKLEYLLIQQSVQQTKNQLQRIKEDLSDLFGLLYSKLRSLGIKDMEELLSAFERSSKIEKIDKRIEELLKILELVQRRELVLLGLNYKELAKLIDQKRDLEGSLERLSQEHVKTTESLKQIEEQISSINLPADISSQLHELSLKKLEREAYSKLRDQMTHVRDFLEDELNRLTGTYVERFSRSLKDLFAEFTNLSQNMYVEPDLSVRFFVRNQLTSTAESLSRATLDQLLFCYKVALYNTLEPEESLPLIIDNFLIRFDEMRLQKAVEILKEQSKKRQIIIFTSDQRLVKIFGVEPTLVLADLKTP